MFHPKLDHLQMLSINQVNKSCNVLRLPIFSIFHLLPHMFRSLSEWSRIKYPILMTDDPDNPYEYILYYYLIFVVNPTDISPTALFLESKLQSGNDRFPIISSSLSFLATVGLRRSEWPKTWIINPKSSSLILCISCGFRYPFAVEMFHFASFLKREMPEMDWMESKKQITGEPRI